LIRLRLVFSGVPQVDSESRSYRGSDIGFDPVQVFDGFRRKDNVEAHLARI
jgi:hypothetical protein